MHGISCLKTLYWNKAEVVRKAPEWKSERIRDKLDAKKKCWMGMATPSFLSPLSSLLTFSCDLATEADERVLLVS